MNFSRGEADLAIRRDFIRRAREAFSTLLEGKHLYQSVEVDGANYPASALPGDADKAIAIPARLEAPNLSGERWIVSKADLPSSTDPRAFVGTVQLTPPDVRLYCASCSRVEPFNLFSAHDLFAHTTYQGSKATNGVLQLFSLMYLCQGCKRLPETLLVRREGRKLTLMGRSPMEHVDVPAFVPKQVRKLYSEAVVAHQSGHTHAGNFLLRALVERWVRHSVTDQSLAIDAAIDAYMASLPREFTDRFTSFRVLYERLSADVHPATGDPAVFDFALAAISQHFDLRRVVEEAPLPPEPTPVPKRPI